MRNITHVTRMKNWSGRLDPFASNLSEAVSWREAIK